VKDKDKEDDDVPVPAGQDDKEPDDDVPACSVADSKEKSRTNDFDPSNIESRISSGFPCLTELTLCTKSDSAERVKRLRALLISSYLEK
jgi:hypothetical protein